MSAIYLYGQSIGVACRQSIIHKHTRSSSALSRSISASFVGTVRARTTTSGDLCFGKRVKCISFSMRQTLLRSNWYIRPTAEGLTDPVWSAIQP
jgi:hypothetical protein